VQIAICGVMLGLAAEINDIRANAGRKQAEISISACISEFCSRFSVFKLHFSKMHAEMRTSA